MLLLDTNVAIDILRGRKRRVRDELQLASASSVIALSAITVFELAYGAFKSQHPAVHRARLSALLASDLTVLPFETDDAEVAGRIRASLATAGISIGPYDLLIGAQALRHNLTLVTADTAEFGRIAGLKLATWR